MKEFDKLIWIHIKKRLVNPSREIRDAVYAACAELSYKQIIDGLLAEKNAEPEVMLEYLKTKMKRRKHA